jgi:hypothetical protein
MQLFALDSVEISLFLRKKPEKLSQNVLKTKRLDDETGEKIYSNGRRDQNRNGGKAFSTRENEHCIVLC